jgi:hypothetical protein
VQCSTTGVCSIFAISKLVLVAPSFQDNHALKRDPSETAKAQHIQAHGIRRVLSVAWTVKMRGISVIMMGMAWKYAIGATPIVCLTIALSTVIVAPPRVP